MFLKNLLLLFFSLALTAIGLEGAVRFAIDNGMNYELEMWKYAREVKVPSKDPEIGFRHRPNAAVNLMGAMVRTNQWGFRGPAIAEVPADGVARIAFVGDSITMGWGVAESATFAHQAIAALQKKGRAVDGFNLGVGNYNTSQELNLFKDAGVKMHPDIIALNYFINDAEPTPVFRSPSWLEWHSEAWVVANYGIESITRMLGVRRSWLDYYQSLYIDDQPGWPKTKTALRNFKDFAQLNNIELLLFNIPDIRQMEPYPLEPERLRLQMVFSELGISAVDLLPAVQHLKPASLWVTVPDPHPNAVAQAAFAEMMVRHLEQVLERRCATVGRGCTVVNAKK